MGRATKLTPERADILVEAVGLGLSFAEAARIGEIDERTIHDWRARGKAEPKSIYAQFTQRIDAAQPSRAQEYLDAVKRSILESTTTEEKHVRKIMEPAIRDADGKIISPAFVRERIEEITTKTRPPDIKGALWWLERRLPKLFSRHSEIDAKSTPRSRRDRT